MVRVLILKSGAPHQSEAPSSEFRGGKSSDKNQGGREGGRGGRGGGGGGPAPIHRYTVPSSLPRSAYRRIGVFASWIGVSAYRRICSWIGVSAYRRISCPDRRIGVSAYRRIGVSAYFLPGSGYRRIGVSAYVPPPGHAPAYRRIGARRFCDTICRHAETLRDLLALAAQEQKSAQKALLPSFMRLS